MRKLAALIGVVPGISQHAALADVCRFLHHGAHAASLLVIATIVVDPFASSMRRFSCAADNDWHSVTVTPTGRLVAVAISGTGNRVMVSDPSTVNFGEFVQPKGYTVATLPAGILGERAYVTDAVAPTYLGTLTGGGAVVCPVFFNGAAWVSG